MEYLQFLVNLLGLFILLDILDTLLWRRYFNNAMSFKPIAGTLKYQNASNPTSKANEESRNKRMVNKKLNNKDDDNGYYNDYKQYTDYCYPVVRHIIIPLLDRLLDKILTRIIGRSRGKCQP